MNDNLKFFAHMSSHDLQEPLRKINIFSKMIFEQESGKISRMSKEYFERMQGAAQRMQTLIEKLLNYSQVTAADIPFEMTDLNGLIEEVKVSLKEELQHSNATIAVSSMCSAPIIPFQMQQVFYNLVSNSLKFSIPDRPPKITVSSEIAKGVFF
jgi:light-regulated signal transduction histidine kinase (bacteriophytochrome)